MSRIVISMKRKNQLSRDRVGNAGNHPRVTGGQELSREESTMSHFGGERQAPFWVWDTSMVSNTGDCSTQHV